MGPLKKIGMSLLILALAIPVLAEKDKGKDWLKAKLVDVKTQDMQSANANYNNKNNVNDTGRMVGGSFSDAPTHFIIYNILIETEQEFVWANLSREISFRPPELKIGTEVEYKPSGPKFIELKDTAGKKYEFKVTKREKKEPAPAKQ